MKTNFHKLITGRSLRTSAAVILLTLAGGLRAQNVSLEVHLSGMKNDAGNVRVALYNSQDSFLKKPLQAQQVKIVNGKAQVK